MDNIFILKGQQSAVTSQISVGLAGGMTLEIYFYRQLRIGCADVVSFVHIYFYWRIIIKIVTYA